MRFERKKKLILTIILQEHIAAIKLSPEMKKFVFKRIKEKLKNNYS